MALKTLNAFFVGAVAALMIGSTGCSIDSGNPADDENSDQLDDALNANTKTAFEFFVNKGLKPFQAAGIVGNLIQESGVDPTISQYGGGPGRGIAQWSAGGRWDTSHNANVVWYANQQGKSRYSLELQLEFIWWEFNHEGYGFSKLKASTSIEAATVDFQDDYEICGACDETNRIKFAKQVLAAYGGGGGGGGGHTMPSNCNVHSDGKLYCDNKDNVAMYAGTNTSSGVVNKLETTHSWFKCYGTGALHSGGNHTWYYTLGDQNGHWGWVPAVDLSTPDWFDANPSEYGLKKCN